MPPGQALPDRQPAYVSSWIYVFGVLTLAALVVVLAIGRRAGASAGAAWWHTSAVGHFVNSLHLWSVELFFAFMVIHLWGKFWMAAWRGKRALTWITGVVAFVGSIGTAFTGYLSQSNFDSQWIADAGQGRPQRRRHRRVLQRAQPGPDAAVARGAAAVGHRRADRAARDPGPPARRRAADRRGRRRTEHGPPPPSRPPSTTGATPTRRRPHASDRCGAATARRTRTCSRPGPTTWSRNSSSPVVVIGCSPSGWPRSSPPPTRRRSPWRDWAKRGAGRRRRHRHRRAGRHDAPAPTYGPPYNNARRGQKLGPLPLQKWARRPASRSTARTTSSSARCRREPATPALTAALARLAGSLADQQTAWATRVRRRAGQGARRRPGPGGRPATTARCPRWRPASCLAASGGLEGPLTSSRHLLRRRPDPLAAAARRRRLPRGPGPRRHLGGDQWGMMNETGNYPGQPWMWLYTFWYQVSRSRPPTTPTRWSGG